MISDYLSLSLSLSLSLCQLGPLFPLGVDRVRFELPYSDCDRP